MNEPTLKQKEFVKEYLDSGNGTQSALKVYDTKDPNVAGAIASENLRKPKIRQMIEDACETAFSTVFALAVGAENENVRLNASKDILDRGGLKPIEQTDITSKGEKIMILPAELISKNDSTSNTENSSQ